MEKFVILTLLNEGFTFFKTLSFVNVPVSGLLCFALYEMAALKLK